MAINPAELWRTANYRLNPLQYGFRPVRPREEKQNEALEQEKIEVLAFPIEQLRNVMRPRVEIAADD